MADGTVIANGEIKTPVGIRVEAVAAYDLTPPEPGESPRTKGRDNGYIVTLGGKRLYVAAITECTPEIQAQKDVDAPSCP